VANVHIETKRSRPCRPPIELAGSTHAVVVKPAPELTPDELVEVRRRLNLSRGLFAAYLRTNVRTLENWEQGRARTNAQAAL
jgi:putative transcriptional regulator